MLTLDEIIEGYSSQHRLPESAYFRITQIGIRGLRIFHRDSTGAPQTVNLTVLANGTAVLPSNALTKISVGVLNNRGELASLTYDPILSLFDSINTARANQVTNQTLINNEQFILGFQEVNSGAVPFWGYGQYGVGSQPVIGFYNIDWENRVMVFNFGFNQPTVQFVYLGLYCSDNANYLVDPLFQEALIAYIDWQEVKGNPKSGVGERRDAERYFNVQYRNARFSQIPFDPSDIYNTWRQSLRLAVKT